MRTITNTLGFIGFIIISFAVAYFIVIYDSHFLQLILALGLGAILIFLSFLYLYEWMKEKDEELEDLEKSIDLTRDYVKDLEERYA